MSIDVHFSSAKHDWGTPKHLFDAVDSVFSFDLDAAASSDNALCTFFFTEEDNALIQDWDKFNSVWVNPPYGRIGHDFIKKASESSVPSVLLVPARPDTRSWHNVVFPKASEIAFLKGRIRFNGAEASAPFPSALISFNAQHSFTAVSLDSAVVQVRSTS